MIYILGYGCPPHVHALMCPFLHYMSTQESLPQFTPPSSSSSSHTPDETRGSAIPIPNINIYYIFDQSNHVVNLNSLNTTSSHVSRSFNASPCFCTSSSSPDGFERDDGKVMWRCIYMLFVFSWMILQKGQWGYRLRKQLLLISRKPIVGWKEVCRILHNFPTNTLLTNRICLFASVYRLAGVSEGTCTVPPDSATSPSSPSIPTTGCPIAIPIPMNGFFSTSTPLYQ